MSPSSPKRGHSQSTDAIGPAVTLLQLLEAKRRKLHRLGLGNAINGATAARKFLRDRRIVMLSGKTGLAVMVNALVGEEINGNWLKHHDSTSVYGTLCSVFARSGVYEACVIAGKSTLFDVALGPAIERMASDPVRRRYIESTLDPVARNLLTRVEAAGELRMDSLNTLSPAPSKEAYRKARKCLEGALLVAANSLHTDRGYHTKVLQPWVASAIAGAFHEKSLELTFDEALVQLVIACLKSAVVVPERQLRTWFPEALPTLERLILAGSVVRLDGPNRLVLLRSTLREVPAAAVPCEARNVSASRSRSR